MTQAAGLEFDPQIAASVSNLSINHFYKAFVDKSLVLRPLYQRNLVWNDDQQSFLVDSILRGLPVPEIYIQSTTSASGEERLVVVDGQQRLSTCIRFILGELRLTGDADFDQRWRNKTFAEIGLVLQARFRGFDLVVRKLPSSDEGILREVFRRLNKTVEALEAQELRHAAYTGPLIRLIEAASSQPVFSDISVFSSKDYLRRRHDEFFAEIALAVINKAYPNKKEGLDDLFLTYERQRAPLGELEELEQRIGRVLEQLQSPGLAGLRRTRFRNKSDFYTLLVYLCKQAELLPLADEAADSLMTGLKGLSSLVNDIKREEAERRSIDSLVVGSLGQDALTYLRAVERAASDRLNRVRREKALAAALGPAFASAEPRPLVPADAAWRALPDMEEGDLEAEEAASLEERVSAQQALLTAGPQLIDSAE